MNRTDLGLAALVGLICVVVTVTGWGLLVVERRARLLETTSSAAAEVREAVELRLEGQLATLRGLTEVWGEFGWPSRSERTTNVSHWVAQVEGLDSVLWVDLDDGDATLGVGGVVRSREEIARDVAAARRWSSDPHLVGPDGDDSGRVSYRMFVPSRTPEGHEGVLVARFDAATVLGATLRARGHGHAMSISWQGTELFARGEPSTDPWQKWWRVEGTISAPLGEQWRAVHRPTPELAAAGLTPLPHYLLSIGIVLSVALAILTYQFRTILKQSRALVENNRSLERRGVDLESRVAERTEALEEAVTELGAFNYSVSHDLRSPLGAILNFAAIIEEDYSDRPLGKEGVGMLRRISRSAQRASTLLEDLLNLSRAGRAALNFERVDMNRLARETYAQVAVAEENNDEVEFSVEALPVASCDRALLGNVFANLFTNALKYSRGCEKRSVIVRGRRDGEECIYEVIDNGRGFEMRFVDKLFGLFERLHGQDQVEGTGVGLAIVSRIIKRHGGRVWAEGELGEGARFAFALPVRDVSS